MESNQQSFWQFSDQLRLANLSLNDPIWGNNDFAASRLPEERRRFDTRVGGKVAPAPTPTRTNNNNSDANIGTNTNNSLLRNPVNEGWNAATPVAKSPSPLDELLGLPDDVVSGDFNGFNFGWKLGGSGASANLNDLNRFDDGWKVGGSQVNVPINGGYNKAAIYGEQPLGYPFIGNFVNLKGGKAKIDGGEHGGKQGKKSGGGYRKNGNDNTNGFEGKEGKSDKRFKTLPPSESLPRNEAVGGYIFVCNNDTMQENLQRQLFGLPPRYRDSVRQITPGLPLFLYNYSTHQLHGIFEAASFGGANIDPAAWEDKKCPGESRFPAQVRVITRKVCAPLEEDSFRPILHHYDGPKFRLELNVPEALSLLDIFWDQET
ncbi:DCD domain-containing protein NRP-B-like isoform X2 [Rhodamnia argentea]|uniref:DCD domain-containing protein NRP-B-like isoform X2 n=1 Tax=Rhodamnia argentea TaxID=178133 RepID=A0A8B8PZR0_9MYRT|nr:DCD domain-containing protein NRP-B-like isoform X2 [Rhodamnia argentea]